jgi:hypothetical protein
MWCPAAPPRCSDPPSQGLELLDRLNDRLVAEGSEPVAFDSDCPEGICGSCGITVDDRSHGPVANTPSCRQHLRSISDGDDIRMSRYARRPTRLSLTWWWTAPHWTASCRPAVIALRGGGQGRAERVQGFKRLPTLMAVGTTCAPPNVLTLKQTDAPFRSTSRRSAHRSSCTRRCCGYRRNSTAPPRIGGLRRGAGRGDRTTDVITAKFGRSASPKG